jgi:hypothetical protein
MFDLSQPIIDYLRQANAVGKYAGISPEVITKRLNQKYKKYINEDDVLQALDRLYTQGIADSTDDKDGREVWYLLSTELKPKAISRQRLVTSKIRYTKSGRGITTLPNAIIEALGSPKQVAYEIVTDKTTNTVAITMRSG